jgi:hypothetical protein
MRDDKMKNCKGCKFAKWNTTEAGRLHSSGDGRCTYEWKMPALPACMYWIGFGTPSPYGGHINRKVGLNEHCACYVSK